MKYFILTVFNLMIIVSFFQNAYVQAIDSAENKTESEASGSSHSENSLGEEGAKAESEETNSYFYDFNDLDNANN